MNRIWPLFLVFAAAALFPAAGQEDDDRLDLDRMDPPRRLAVIISLMQSSEGARSLGSYIREASSAPEVSCAEGILSFISSRKSDLSLVEAMRTADVFRAAARSKNHNIRVQGLGGLASLRHRGLADEDLSDLLLNAAPDETGPVLLAIGAVGSDKTVPAIKKFLAGRQATDRNRALAAQALQGIHSPGAVALLRTLAGEKKDYVAINAVAALGSQPLPEAFAALDSITADDRPRIRAAAYSHLYNFLSTGLFAPENGKKFWEYAHRVAGEDLVVQIELAAVLAGGGREEGVSFLADAAPSIKDPSGAARAVSALARSGNDMAFGAMSSLARTSGEIPVMTAFLRGAGRTSDPAAVPLLFKTYMENDSLLLRESALEGLLAAGGAPPDEIIAAVKAEGLRLPHTLLMLSVARRPLEETRDTLREILQQHTELPGRMLPSVVLILLGRRGAEKAVFAFQEGSPERRIISDGPEAVFADAASSESVRNMAWLVAVMEEEEGPAARILDRIIRTAVVWESPHEFPRAMAWRRDLLPVILANWKSLPPETRISVIDSVVRFMNVPQPAEAENADRFISFFTGVKPARRTAADTGMPTDLPQDGQAALVLERGTLFWKSGPSGRPPVIWLDLPADEVKRLRPVVHGLSGMVITSPYVRADVRVAHGTPPAELEAATFMNLADFLHLIGLDALPAPAPGRQVSDEELQRIYDDVKRIHDELPE